MVLAVRQHGRRGLQIALQSVHGIRPPGVVREPAVLAPWLDQRPQQSSRRLVGQDQEASRREQTARALEEIVRVHRLDRLTRMLFRLTRPPDIGDGRQLSRLEQACYLKTMLQGKRHQPRLSAVHDVCRRSRDDDQGLHDGAPVLDRSVGRRPELATHQKSVARSVQIGNVAGSQHHPDLPAVAAGRMDSGTELVRLARHRLEKSAHGLAHGPAALLEPFYVPRRCYLDQERDGAAKREHVARVVGDYRRVGHEHSRVRRRLDPLVDLIHGRLLDDVVVEAQAVAGQAVRHERQQVETRELHDPGIDVRVRGYADLDVVHDRTKLVQVQHGGHAGGERGMQRANRL